MKKSLFLLAATAALASGCNADKGKDGASGATVNAAVVAPPEGGDWSQVVNPTEAGGFVMGNPNAAVKLIEFGSMTCPHCREFDEAGAQPLIDNYVKKGQVSWEFRNYVRDPYDVAASLIVRCNGAQSFFPLMRAMYEDQPNWIAKLQQIPPAEMQQLGSLPPAQQFTRIAQAAGFQQWAAQRGLPSAKTSQCLSNQTEIEKLVQMNSDATNEYPDMPGTPSFVLNGDLIEGGRWTEVEAALKGALG